jgi:hypothetical protein
MAHPVTAVQTVAFLSSFDIVKPHKRNQLFQRFGIEQGFDEFLNRLGLSEPVDNIEYSHFEQGWFHDTFKVNGTVADQGAGNDILVTLHADSVDDDDNIYPQKYDVVKNPRTGAVGQITNVDFTTPSAPILTIRPNASATSFGGVTAGDELILFSNAWPEGSAQPNGRVSKEDEYSFKLQIVKGTTEVTGSAQITRDWFDTLSHSGQSIPAKYMLTDIEEDMRVQLFIDQAMMWNEPVTNTGVERQMTGLIPWVRTNGNIGLVDPGMFTLVQFDVMKNTLDRQQAPNEMYGALGTHLYTNVENIMMDFLSDGAAIYMNNASGVKPADIGIDVKSFKKGGRTYHLHEMRIWNHQKLHGVANSTSPSTGVWMPLDFKKDAKTREKVPSIRKRYAKLGAYSRMMEIWPTGAAGGDFSYNSQTDQKQVNYRCEVGTEYFGANRFYLTEPS